MPLTFRRITVVLLFSLAGCANEFPACTWYEVSGADLAIECRDADPKLRACQTGITTCNIWVRNDLK